MSNAASPSLAPPPEVDVPRSAWIALGVSSLIFFLVVIDISAVNVAFPWIASDFGVSESSLSWIISGYNITVASLLLVSGRLADSLGRKRLFIPGVAIFMVGSMLSGLAWSANSLIAARVVQAVGGAIVSPTALAVVLPDFPPSKRSTVIGFAGVTGGLGAVVGPALGSVLIDVWSWRGIFLINVPLCLLVLFLAPRLLRESRNPAATGRIDFWGVPIGTLGIGLIMFAIVQTEEWGLVDGRTAALFVTGLALVAALIRRSAHQAEPLIELDLFRHQSFWSANIGLAFYSMAFTAGFLVNSLLLQDFWNQDIRTTGLALVPAPLASAFFAPLSGRLADRVGHRWILAIGSVFCATGYVGQLILFDAEPHVFDYFVPLSLLTGIGVGTTIATWASAGLSDVEPPKFGSANATIRTTQQVFYALGISVVIALLASGTALGGLEGYRWAWLWVVGMYVAAAVAIAVTFPAGSSRDRA